MQYFYQLMLFLFMMYSPFLYAVNPTDENSYEEISLNNDSNQNNKSQTKEKAILEKKHEYNIYSSSNQFKLFSIILNNNNEMFIQGNEESINYPVFNDRESITNRYIIRSLQSKKIRFWFYSIDSGYRLFFYLRSPSANFSSVWIEVSGSTYLYSLLKSASENKKYNMVQLLSTLLSSRSIVETVETIFNSRALTTNGNVPILERSLLSYYPLNVANDVLSTPIPILPTTHQQYNLSLNFHSNQLNMQFNQMLNIVINESVTVNIFMPNSGSALHFISPNIQSRGIQVAEATRNDEPQLSNEPQSLMTSEVTSLSVIALPLLLTYKQQSKTILRF